MRKFFTPLNIIFVIEVVIVILTSLGLIPREAILIWTGLAIFYIIFSPVQDSLYLVIMSIPLFVALPITENFDTMANWRILIGVLFLSLFFRMGVLVSLIKESDTSWHLRENVKHYLMEYLSWIFLFIAAISIFVARYKILALKQWLFLINIFLLNLIIRKFLAKADKEELILKSLRALAIGSGAVISVGLMQLGATFFIPLSKFWQFWAGKVVPVFYGKNLSQLLLVSNTWFSYSNGKPPILRIFSLFPDSHSLAMFLLLSTPIFLSLAVFENSRRKKFFFWILSGLASLLIILSGSRGAWLSFIPVCVAALYLFFKKIEFRFTKKIIFAFSLFLAIFFASYFYPVLYYKAQSLQGDFSLFDRAKSISDFDELSNKTRLQIWLASAKSIIIHPILGVGLGNYVTVLNEDVSAAKQGASAHNLYLDFASEIGIIGASLLFVIFLIILRDSWLIFKKADTEYLKAFALFFGVYFLWIMIYSLFDVVLLNDKVLLLFLAELGILYSIKALVEKEKKQINSY